MATGIYRIRHRQPASVNAHPYRIAVIDPRPTFDQGKAYIAEFNVDEPLPTLTIPLNGTDQLRFDFDAPYQKTYTETLYGLELVDYRQLPLHFDRYSSADQARVANRMVAVLRAVEGGEDSEDSVASARSASDHSSRSSIFIINPVLQLVGRYYVSKIFYISRNQYVVPSDHLRSHEDICVSLPSLQLIFETSCYGQRLFIKIQNLKFIQQSLRLAKQLLCAS